jgi:glycosyltransferase involved in cell wall biosynthesis
MKATTQQESTPRSNRKSLKILFVTEFLPWPLDTGGRIRTYHILRQAALRHEVTLVTQVPLGEKTGEENIRKFVSRLYSVPLRSKSGIRKVLSASMALASARPYVSVYSHYRRPLARLIENLMHDGSFDIVHLDHLDSAAYLKECSSKVVTYVDEHNYETKLLQSTRGKTSQRLIGWYLSAQLKKLELFENETLKVVDAVSVVSAQDAEVVASVAPCANLEIIPNGVDPAFFDIPRQPRPYRIVSVGSLDWLPNVEGLIWFLDEVWPRVAAARPQATVHIVGRNPQRSIVKRVSRRVTLAGSVLDIREHVTDASAFVVPLHAGGGTRLRVLEAMAMRIPIVSTRVGIEGIECKHGQHVLTADTAEGFATELIRLLDSQALREHLANEGRKLVEDHYSWRAIGGKLDAFYRRMVPQA